MQRADFEDIEHECSLAISQESAVALARLAKVGHAVYDVQSDLAWIFALCIARPQSRRQLRSMGDPDNRYSNTRCCVRSSRESSGGASHCVCVQFCPSDATSEGRFYGLAEWCVAKVSLTGEQLAAVGHRIWPCSPQGPSGKQPFERQTALSYL